MVDEPRLFLGKKLPDTCIRCAGICGQSFLVQPIGRRPVELCQLIKEHRQV